MEDAVDEGIGLDERRPLGFDEPGEMALGVSEFERSQGGQSVDDVSHGAQPDGQDVETRNFADDEHARSTAGRGAYRRLPG
jgi:hypothetical protein